MYAITIHLRCTDAESVSLVRRASLEVVAPSRAEPGCLFFDVLFDESDPLVIRFYESYQDRAAFDAHLAAPHAQRWVQVCMPHVDRRSIRMPESVSDRPSGGDRVVVVFGATGQIGTEVVKLLAGDPRCKEVRALSRDPGGDEARLLTAFGPSVRIVPFRMDNLLPACEGATDAFIVAPLTDDAAGLHTTVARALATARVGHVVKVSVTGARPPESDPPPGRIPSLHWAGEEALRGAGLKTTVIRPTIFMQHFEMGSGLYERGDSRFYLPSGEAGVAFLDCRDIAAMGHALLFSPAAAPFYEGAYALTGPEAVTGAQIAGILSAIRQAPVEHVDGIPGFEARCAELGKPDRVKFVYAEAAGGWFSEVQTRVFEVLVGRRPRSFAAWADDRAYGFRA